MSVNKKDWSTIYFDGAAEPTNLGPAAAAAIIDLPTGESIPVGFPGCVIADTMSLLVQH